jgi:hypothetical protein
MNIWMTIDATETDLPEVPLFGFQMAGKTGGGQMCAFQGENSCIMLLNSI